MPGAIQPAQRLHDREHRRRRVVQHPSRRTNRTPSRPPRIACRSTCSDGVGYRRMPRAYCSSRAPVADECFNEADIKPSRRAVAVTARSPRRSLRDARPTTCHQSRETKRRRWTRARREACARAKPGHADCASAGSCPRSSRPITRQQAAVPVHPRGSDADATAPQRARSHVQHTAFPSARPQRAVPRMPVVCGQHEDGTAIIGIEEVCDPGRGVRPRGRQTHRALRRVLGNVTLMSAGAGWFTRAARIP